MPEQCYQLEGDPVVSNISFKSGHVICRGVHYMPLRRDDMDDNNQLPCVILAHGFGGTIDAGLHPYARAFSEAGLHSLLFDYRHFGASDGEPRQLISIREQLADWHAAIAFARSQKGVDPERIILWGVSLSGGHVINVAARDGGIAAVIAQYPMLDGLAALKNINSYAGYSQILKLVVAGIQDLLGGWFGNTTKTIPIVGPPGELAALSTAEAEPGYRAITPPEWENRVCARIALAIPFYRPGFSLSRIDCPVLVQIADQDSILPPASIERFILSSRIKVQARHYASGHFDAFTGDLFRLSAGDQVKFILTALSGLTYESNAT